MDAQHLPRYLRGVGSKIYLVDDNQLDLAAFRYALFEVGLSVDVETCVTVATACDRISQPSRIADIILLDLSLTDGTGFDVLHALRQSVHHRFTPVVIFSGSDRADDITRAYAFGANAYVVKPQEFTELVHAVQTLKAFWFDHVRLPP